jgi:hypothetical protein
VTSTVTAVSNGILSLQFARPTGYTGYWSVVGLEIATGSLPNVAPQVLTGLEFEPGGALSEESAMKLSAMEQRGVSLSEELVLEVREHVLAAWATTGLSAEAQQRLQSATVQITDLNDRGMLGIAGTDEIWLDDDALGYGWSFTDDADNDGDGEADLAVPEGTVDLATVMAHEFGHLVGWSDLDPEQYPGHLMAGELAVGERRGVGSLDNEAVVGESKSQNTSVVVSAQPLDLSANEEPLEAGTLLAAANDLAMISVPARREGRKVNQDATGRAILPSSKSPETDSPLGSSLSLLDDLFSDLSLLP